MREMNRLFSRVSSSPLLFFCINCLVKLICNSKSSASAGTRRRAVADMGKFMATFKINGFNL